MAKNVWIDFDPLIRPAILVSRDRWRDFSQARHFVRSLKFPSRAEYRKWVKSSSRPLDIPAAPDKVLAYRAFWKGWSDWLHGSPNHELSQASDTRSFQEARKWLEQSGLIRTRARK